MTGFGVFELFVLPGGLGLLGFVEPCSIGSTLLFIRYLDERPPARRLLETVLFTLTRALFTGGLGVLAVLVGSAFTGLQRGAWIALGLLYVVIGTAALFPRSRTLLLSFGPGLGRISGVRASVGLGVLFGLNIPACAAPLLLLLLGLAAGAGATGAALGAGFTSLAVFGLALSLPLLVLVAFPATRRLLDRLAGLSRRVPALAGLVLMAVGLWSIGFGLYAELPGLADGRATGFPSRETGLTP